MPRGPKITHEERERALTLLHENGSVYQTARAVGRDDAAVSRIASSEGLDIKEIRRRNLAKATEALQDFAKIRRLELGNKLAATLDELLDAGGLDPGQARALKDLSIAFGVLTDKRRLEDGQSTANLAQDIRIWRATSPPDFLPKDNG